MPVGRRRGGRSSLLTVSISSVGEKSSVESEDGKGSIEDLRRRGELVMYECGRRMDQRNSSVTAGRQKVFA